MYDSMTTVTVGLDVHARSVRLAAVRADELLEERTLPYDEDAVEQVLRRWLGVRCCYEAGPTGFGLYRHLIGRGIDCSVDARGPSAQSRGASPVSRGPAAAVRCSLALGRGKEDANRDALDGGRLVADVLPVAAADVDRFERINVVGRHDAYIVWLSRLLKDKLPLHAQAKSRGLGKMRIAARRDFGFDRNRRAPLRDATAVIEKQHRAIAALTEKVARLETLLDQSLHIAKAIARDPDLLMKTVDLLLAESVTARKEAAAHPVRDDTTERVKAATAGRLFTQHGGNVLPIFRSDF
jgi:hypothetical protein